MWVYLQETGKKPGMALKIYLRVYGMLLVGIVKTPVNLIINIINGLISGIVSGVKYR